MLVTKNKTFQTQKASVLAFRNSKGRKIAGLNSNMSFNAASLVEQHTPKTKWLMVSPRRERKAESSAEKKRR